jgi:predicted RNase H-like HicB family nuclease
LVRRTIDQFIERKIGLGGTMTKQFDVIVERDSAGYFVASVPAIPGCHTQAKSLDDLMSRIKEAIELCLEVDGDAMEALDFVGVQRISIAA